METKINNATIIFEDYIGDYFTVIIDEDKTYKIYVNKEYVGTAKMVSNNQYGCRLCVSRFCKKYSFCVNSCGVKSLREILNKYEETVEEDNDITFIE